MQHRLIDKAGKRKRRIFGKLLPAAAICIALLTGCHQLREGEIYDMDYTPAHFQYMYLPQTTFNGENSTTTIVPFLVYHPDTWSVRIKAYDAEKEEWQTATYYVDEATYQNAVIGGMFKYDQDTCKEDAPYTREPLS